MQWRCVAVHVAFLHISSGRNCHAMPCNVYIVCQTQVQIFHNVPWCKTHFTSTLVVMLCKSNAFSMSTSFAFSWSHGHGPTQSLQHKHWTNIAFMWHHYQSTSEMRFSTLFPSSLHRHNGEKAVLFLCSGCTMLSSISWTDILLTSCLPTPQ